MVSKMGKIDDFIKTSGDVIDMLDKGVDYLEIGRQKLDNVHQGINLANERMKQIQSGELDEEKRKCVVWDLKAEKMKKRYKFLWIIIFIATIIMLFII